jgi:hypothetical protein
MTIQKIVLEQVKAEAPQLGSLAMEFHVKKTILEMDNYELLQYISDAIEYQKSNENS